MFDGRLGSLNWAIQRPLWEGQQSFEEIRSGSIGAPKTILKPNQKGVISPIGHKIALSDLKTGDTATKYGEDIGKIVADIAQGEHVHTHNCKTKRW